MTPHGDAADHDPAIELAIAHAMVNRLRSPGPEMVRAYRPSGQTVVFGRRDTRLRGFRDAVSLAREQGFTPLVRSTGGRAVAYTNQALVIDHARHEPGGSLSQDDRFASFGSGYVTALRELGIPAQLGPVPGEYCPGAHSVNSRGTVKLIGTSQRITSRGWLFSSLVELGDADLVRQVLTAVYRALEQPFEPACVGTISDELPGLGHDTVRQRLVSVHTGGAPGVDCTPGADLLAEAAELAARHRC